MKRKRERRAERVKEREIDLKDRVEESLWVVIIFCFLVHDELVVHEVEAIGLGFPWTADEVLLLFLVQLRHLVDHLPGILAIRNAESKGEVEALEEVLLEIMPLNHPKIRYFFIAN